MAEFELKGKRTEKLEKRKQRDGWHTYNKKYVRQWEQKVVESGKLKLSPDAELRSSKLKKQKKEKLSSSVTTYIYLTLVAK